MLKRILTGILLTGMVLCCTGCASCDREWKTFQSDLGGGLERTVILYDEHGELIQTWSGKFDIQTNQTAGKVLFDNEDGRRVIIHGGIVVIEEDE